MSVYGVAQPAMASSYGRGQYAQPSSGTISATAVGSQPMTSLPQGVATASSASLYNSAESVYNAYRAMGQSLSLPPAGQSQSLALPTAYSSGVQAPGFQTATATSAYTSGTPLPFVANDFCQGSSLPTAYSSAQSMTAPSNVYPGQTSESACYQRPSASQGFSTAIAAPVAVSPSQQSGSNIMFQPHDPPNPIPTDTGVERLDVHTVHQLMKTGQCVLIDLRSYDRGSGEIEGTLNVSSSEFPINVPQLARQLAGERLVVFTCQYSAHRSPQCANWYKEGSPPGQRVAIMTGGFRGWEAAGLPVKGAANNSSGNSAYDAFALQQGLEMTWRNGTMPMYAM